MNAALAELGATDLVVNRAPQSIAQVSAAQLRADREQPIDDFLAEFNEAAEQTYQADLAATDAKALSRDELTARRLTAGVRVITGRVPAREDVTSERASGAPVGTLVETSDSYAYYKVAPNTWHASWAQHGDVYRPGLDELGSTLTDAELPAHRRAHEAGVAQEWRKVL